MDKPLVSLCITCYNQARFIREAVQSAFDQTYDPLEIVICDDHSTDGTDKIVEEMVADYQAKGGRHTVIFKRNETNLYVMKNYEQAFRLAHGELLITGAGDDISMPNRAERIVEAWEKSGRKATCIIHGWVSVDITGKSLYKSNPWPLRTLLGASSSYTKKVVTEFASLPDDHTIYEDNIFSARATMYGPEVLIEEPLIKYRVGGGETTKVNFLEHRNRIDHHVLKSCEIVDAELEQKKSSITAERYDATHALTAWRRGRFGAEQKLLNGAAFKDRREGYKEMTPQYEWKEEEWWYISYLQFLFPKTLRPLVVFIIGKYFFMKHLPRRAVRKIMRIINHSNEYFRQGA